MGNIPNQWPINVRSDHQVAAAAKPMACCSSIERFKGSPRSTSVRDQPGRSWRVRKTRAWNSWEPRSHDVKKYNWLVVEPIFVEKNNIPLVGHILLI